MRVRLLVVWLDFWVMCRHFSWRSVAHSTRNETRNIDETVDAYAVIHGFAYRSVLMGSYISALVQYRVQAMVFRHRMTLAPQSENNNRTSIPSFMGPLLSTLFTQIDTPSRQHVISVEGRYLVFVSSQVGFYISHCLCTVRLTEYIHASVKVHWPHTRYL